MWMDAEMYWFQPQMLASSSLSSAVLRRETEEERHMKRQPSKGGHHTALFADCSMHTSTPNHTAVNKCGGLGMERFKVNKHHSPLAESAGGYVNLGCVPAALLYVHSWLLLYSNNPGSLLLRVNWKACTSICYADAVIVCTILLS